MRRLLLGWILPFALAAADAPFASLTGKPPFPPDNPPTGAKVELGKKLFFEGRLSGPGNRSCGTCHKPELMFSDGLSRAWGIGDNELRRRTPMLYNVGWQERLFHDGRVGSLEEQAAFPLRSETEMNINPDEAIAKLAKDPEYIRMFDQAFPGKPIEWGLAAQALSTYQRSLVSYDSDFDRYLSGNAAALSDAAKRGMELFTSSSLGCASCHSGALLTDQKLHYIGVPEMLGDNAQGSKYKTPSLRDVALRGSYMHNGRYRSMDEVLDLYTGVGVSTSVASEVPAVKLTPEQKKDLVAFLRSLNGRVYSVDF